MRLETLPDEIRPRPVRLALGRLVDSLRDSPHDPKRVLQVFTFVLALVTIMVRGACGGGDGLLRTEKRGENKRVATDPLDWLDE